MKKLHIKKDVEILNGLLRLANIVRKIFLECSKRDDSKNIVKREFGGDPHYNIDELAESAVEEFLKNWNVPVTAFSEDRGLVNYSDNPEWILIIDPIDGTRPALANFESCCFSAVAVPYSKNPKFKDIEHALVLELKSGEYYYANKYENKILSTSKNVPALSQIKDVEKMFWSTELTAHPIKHITRVCEDLIDGSVTLGAIFVFTSSSYSLTRIVTGQLDAHVDTGHRIISDNNSLMDDFLKVGRGKLVTLFSYDIAAAAYILLKAGGIVTDAYGKSLDELLLVTDKSLTGQCSIVAASNKILHDNIMSKLKFETCRKFDYEKILKKT